MTLDLIVYFAQMLTALATLAVAYVLITQVRLQHAEAQRQLVLSINEQRQHLALTLAGDPELSSINSRGGADYGDLNQMERIRFNRIFQAEMSLSNIDQYAGLTRNVIGAVAPIAGSLTGPVGTAVGSAISAGVQGLGMYDRLKSETMAQANQVGNVIAAGKRGLK